LRACLSAASSPSPAAAPLAPPPPPPLLEKSERRSGEEVDVALEVSGPGEAKGLRLAMGGAVALAVDEEADAALRDGTIVISFSSSSSSAAA